MSLLGSSDKKLLCSQLYKLIHLNMQIICHSLCIMGLKAVVLFVFQNFILHRDDKLKEKVFLLVNYFSEHMRMLSIKLLVFCSQRLKQSHFLPIFIEYIALKIRSILII